MLKSFRRIRQKLLDDGKFKKYLTYTIGEIFLVMVGILLALQVNNWNQKRIDTNIQNEYLQRIRMDIKKDLENITNLNVRHQNRVIKVQKFIKYFGQEMIHQDTFNNLYWATFHADNFIPHDDTYGEMISTGELDIINNNQLKFKVLDLYSHYDQINNFEDHIHQDNREFIYNLSIKLFDWDIAMSSNDKVAFNEEFKKVSSSIHMKNAYLLFSNISPKMTNLYTTGISKINQLDSMLINELNLE